jgi:hypothetical protein
MYTFAGANKVVVYYVIGLVLLVMFEESRPSNIIQHMFIPHSQLHFNIFFRVLFAARST